MEVMHCCYDPLLLMGFLIRPSQPLELTDSGNFAFCCLARHRLTISILGRVYIRTLIIRMVCVNKGGV